MVLTHMYMQVLVYRIAGNFRGYKCSWFSLIKHVPRAFMPTNFIPHACMFTKGCYSATTFLKVFPRNFIPSKYTLYGICTAPSEFGTCTCIIVIVYMYMYLWLSLAPLPVVSQWIQSCTSWWEDWCPPPCTVGKNETVKHINVHVMNKSPHTHWLHTDTLTLTVTDSPAAHPHTH